jgi:hypothetical protein
MPVPPTLRGVVAAIESLSRAERALLAERLVAMAERTLRTRLGAGTILNWVAHVAIGRNAPDISLGQIPDEDRFFVRELADRIRGYYQGAATIRDADTVADLFDNDPAGRDDLAEVWARLVDAMDATLDGGGGSAD